MVKVRIECLGEEKYLDEYLVTNLDALKQAVSKDWDGLLFVFGREGVGKSTFALQVASYLDPEFSIDKVAWTPEQFMAKVLAASKYSCIVLDEAYLTFTSRSAIGKFQQVIIGMLTMIRSRNLFLIVVSPTIFDMSKYLVVHRALAAFRCYHRGMERGYWELYGEDAKLQLYVKGRRDNDLRVAEPDLRGRFGTWFPVNKAEYERRKGLAVDELRSRMLKPEPKTEDVERLERSATSEVLSFLTQQKLLKHGALVRVAEHFDIAPSSLTARIGRAKSARRENFDDSARTSIKTYPEGEAVVRDTDPEMIPNDADAED